MANTNPTKATMAPAARDPEGAGKPDAAPAPTKDTREPAVPDWMNASLQGVSRDELMGMRRRIDNELGRIESGARGEEPSFGISEGTREELERTGRATSPFTGRQLEGESLGK
jgi:hypothetical protein